MERQRNYKRKEGRLEVEDRRVEREEKIGVPLVGRSIPLMKYIVKLREGEDGEEERWDVVREGTIRKVAASRCNEQKREGQRERRRGRDWRLSL